MPNALITTFVCACIAGLALLCGFFAQQVYNSIKAVVADLGAAVKELSSTVQCLKIQMAGHDKDLAQMRKELDEITGDIECPRANCLYQGPRLPSAVNHG